MSQSAVDSVTFEIPLARPEGTVRPDWDALYAHLERVEETERPAVWRAALRRWLGAFAECLGEGHRLVETDHVLLITPREDRAAEEFADFVARARRSLVRAL